MFSYEDFQKTVALMQAKEDEKRKKLLKKLEDASYLPTREEVTKAFEAHANELLGFCENRNIFEFFNVEYIEELANYINSRKSVIKPKGKMTILEIGAGNGKLAHYLNEFTGHDINVVATDSGEWSLDSGIFQVEKLTHKEAIEKYSPDMVICSWMPRGLDLTSDFQSEYILIGSPEHCATKHVWRRGVILENLTELQICKLDLIGSQNPPESVTMSFEKGG